MSLFENFRVRVVAASTAADTSAITSSTVDMRGYKDVAFFVTLGTPATNNILKLRGSDDDSTYADISGAVVVPGATDGAQYVRLVKPAKRYIQAVVTRGTSSALGPILAFQGDARIDPQSNNVTGEIVGVTVAA
jgi:hypothetical protein